MDINKYIKYKYKYLNLLNKYRSHSPDKRNRSQSPNRRNRSQSPNRRNRSHSSNRRNRSQSPDKRNRSHSSNRRNISQSPDRRNRSQRRNRLQRRNRSRRRNRSPSAIPAIQVAFRSISPPIIRRRRNTPPIIRRRRNTSPMLQSTVNREISINSPNRDTDTDDAINKQKRINIADDNRSIVISNKYNLNIQTPKKVRIVSNDYISIDKKNIKDNKTQIVFFKGTTNEAIIHFYKKKNNNKICILNFANSHHVGGGYLGGYMAQEEELCRTIIDLFPSLALLASRKSRNYYDFKWNRDVLYSSNLSLYRYDAAQSNNNYDFIDKNVNPKPIKISVITAAAPNLRIDRNRKEPTPKTVELVNNFRSKPNDLYEILFDIIKGIYLVPIQIEKNINILILGAFGCGAFSPHYDLQKQMNIDYTKDIASIFLRIIEKIPDILHLYDYICFAIPDNNKDNNYKTFYNVFKKSQNLADIVSEIL